jgi:alpha-L-rhamnosidase
MTHRIRSAYIIGPAGRGTFRNRFNYSSGRWIRITGLAYQPRLEDIRGYLVHTDYRRTGTFTCSDPLLNKIYAMTLWTFENLSLGSYVVDCPQRERMGYGGDAHATTKTALNSYDLGAFYTTWSQAWRDCQGDDGNLPYTAPTYWGGGGPAWSGFCITLPYLVYRRYGDVRILEENFETGRRWLAFLETKAENDLLVRWGGKWDFLGDWLWPGAQGVNGDTVETLFFNNCYWVYNLLTAARIAEALGKPDVAGAYRSRAETVRRAVHRKFFQAEEHTYVNSFQAYLAAALLAGVPPKKHRAAVWKRLEEEILVVRKGHFHAGITGGYFLIEALLDNDRPDLIYTMATAEGYPGYADMLAKDATTWWEAWDGRNSLLHSSFLWIGTWFTEGLAGIRLDPEVAGYKRFVIKPGVYGTEGLTQVSAEYESVYGTITSAWETEGENLRLRVTVPPNTEALVHVPVEDPSAVREGGKPAAEAKGVKRLGDEPRHAVFRVQPGRYRFEAVYR